jgi:hypothetical protein
MEKYSFLAFIFILFSCSSPQKRGIFTDEQLASLHLDSTTILRTETDSVTRVDLNPFLKKNTYFDLGSLVKEVKLVALETTDESLLDNILKIIVTDSHIYIMDDLQSGGLVIFSNEGKFVKRIPHGQGPGELARLYHIAYDFENNELVAYRHSFLMFFTPSGEFIREERFLLEAYNFTIIPDGYLFKEPGGQSNQQLGELANYTLFVTDKKFRLKSVSLFSPPSEIRLVGYDYLYNNNEEIKVTETFNDTIYQYVSASNKLKAQYVLDYTSKKLPDRFLKGSNESFKNAIHQNDYNFYLGDYLETTSQSLFYLKNQQIGSTVVYMDKKSGHLIGGTDVGFNPMETPPIGFPTAVSGKYFISIHRKPPIKYLFVFGARQSVHDSSFRGHVYY